MVKLLKRVVGKFRRDGVAGVAQAAWNRIRELVVSHPIAYALRDLGRKPSFSVVQIGAYIGPSSNDPLSAFFQSRAGHGLKAILVEPVHEYFERLRENYRGLEGLHFENIAIAETSGERDFYRLGVKPGDFGFPDEVEQYGSLMADRMTDMWQRYGGDERTKEFYQKHRVVERVRCLTLADLLAKYDIKQLDLLQIDAEGYDYEILKTIDFKSLRPSYINYERAMLGKDKETACRAMLTNAGYKLSDYDMDTFCTLTRG